MCTLFFSCIRVLLPLLVSSSESEDTERQKRKRAHSPSRDSDTDSEPKRPKPTPKKDKKVQKPVSSFLSVSAVHSADNGQSSASPTTFNVDTIVEVYRFGHTKCHYKRHTIVCSSLLNKSLSDFKKSSREFYGLQEDARRANIGSFEIDVGICPRTTDCNLATFTGKTEEEWQNVVGRLSSQLHQYLLLSE